MKIIGISGRMGTGKTAISEGLIKMFADKKVVRLSMASPIKELHNLIYDKVPYKLVGEKDRDLLLALGKWGRSKSPDFWLNAFHETVVTMDADLIICDDIRFVNEAEYVKEHGILLRLRGLQRGPNVDKNINDVTETVLDTYNFPYYIDNRRPEENCIIDAYGYINRRLNELG